MVRRGSKSVGSGITAGSVTETWLDLNDPGEAARFAEAHKQFHDSLTEPWAYQGRVIAGVRARLAEIRAELSHVERFTHEYESYFRERDTEAWYVREMDVTARIVELAVEGGRHWEAVARAMQLGELLAEWRLKAWDRDAVSGSRDRRARAEGAKALRRQPRQQRVELVNSYVAKGHSKAQAFHLAGRELGIHWTTVRSDYYLKKLYEPVG